MNGSTLKNNTLAQSYTTATGTDIYVLVGNMIMVNVQGVSYSITRQKAPIYTMGSSDLRSIGRGKRGIAGSIIMTTFDRHALGSLQSQSTFAAKIGSFENSSANPFKNLGQSSPISAVAGQTIQTAPVSTADASAQTVAELIESQTNLGQVVSDGSNTTDLGNQMAVEETPMYSDQLLPLDLTLVSATEYGTTMAMRIFGVEFLNEGAGVSVDDVSNELQLTFMARFISPWTPQERITATR